MKVDNMRKKKKKNIFFSAKTASDTRIHAPLLANDQTMFYIIARKIESIMILLINVEAWQFDKFCPYIHHLFQHQMNRNHFHQQ